MVSLLSINLLLSVCGIGAYASHRHHFVNENKTWIEAQAYCRLKYTDLATIKSMQEMSKLNYAPIKRKGIQAWIGLEKYHTYQRSRLFGNQTLDEIVDFYRNLDPWHPPYYYEIESCAIMYNHNGKRDYLNCTSLNHFVCYDEKSTNKYIMINETKTWREAQIYCRENHTDLASVTNQTVNDEVWKLINSSAYDSAWMGVSNEFEWWYHSKFFFTYLNVDNPPENSCAAVSESEQRYWINLDCQTKLPFICYENFLILIKENLTWNEALSYCRTHHYDLVSVRTEEMQAWVNDVVLGASTEHVWLGLRFDYVQCEWFWVYGSMMCYDGWAPGNGTWNHGCRHEERRSGAVQSGGHNQWIELPEIHKLNFICATYDDMFY